MALCPEILALATSVLDALAANDHAHALAGLEQLIGNSPFPRDFLQSLKLALRDQAWDGLTEAFLQRRFVGEDGWFLFFAPYRMRTHTAMTGILAQALPDDPEEFRGAVTEAERLTGSLPQTPVPVISCRAVHAIGIAAGQQGEAFLVPNAWSIRDASEGPAINDLGKQKARIDQRGEARLREIFEPTSSALLLGSKRSEAQWLIDHAREFQLHEIAHCTGLGLVKKLDQRLLTKAHHAGVEEWRSDGIAFLIASRILNADDAAALVLANWRLRFAVDAQRLETRPDANLTASLLLLRDLLAVGAVELTAQGRLQILDQSPAGIVAGALAQTTRALLLTQREKRAAGAEELRELYQSIQPGARSREIFRDRVRPVLEEKVG